LKKELTADDMLMGDSVNRIGGPREERGLGVLKDVFRLDDDPSDPRTFLRAERGSSSGDPCEERHGNHQQGAGLSPPAHRRGTRITAVNTP
jgi:hypothetical protein